MEHLAWERVAGEAGWPPQVPNSSTRVPPAADGLAVEKPEGKGVPPPSGNSLIYIRSIQNGKPEKNFWSLRDSEAELDTRTLARMGQLLLQLILNVQDSVSKGLSWAWPFGVSLQTKLELK